MDPQSTVGDPLHRINVMSEQLRERAMQMQRELEAVKEVVESRDGIATVTVGAGGILRDLRIGGGSGATPEHIRTAIMSAYQQGCRAVGEKAADITERFAPGSPAVAMMREAIPPDPDPDGDDSAGSAGAGAGTWDSNTRGGWKR